MPNPVLAKDEIQNVATISANGDKHIGGILAGIFDRLGANGTISGKECWRMFKATYFSKIFLKYASRLRNKSNKHYFINTQTN